MVVRKAASSGWRVVAIAVTCAMMLAMKSMEMIIRILPSHSSVRCETARGGVRPHAAHEAKVSGPIAIQAVASTSVTAGGEHRVHAFGAAGRCSNGDVRWHARLHAASLTLSR